MNFIALIAVFVTALGLFTYLCIPKGRYRVTGTLVFVGLASSAFAMSFETAGQPKPLNTEWRDMMGERVIGFVPNEEAKIIYLWVMRDGVPISYVRPWSEGVEEMQDAWKQREDSGDEFYLVDDDSQIAEVKREPQPPVKEPQ